MFQYDFKDNTLSAEENSGFREVVIFDTDMVDAQQILISDLTKGNLERCSLFVAIGSRSKEFEDIVDDFLTFDSDTLFFPTTTASDLADLSALIVGWDTGHAKRLHLYARTSRLLDRLKLRLESPQL